MKRIFTFCFALVSIEMFAQCEYEKDEKILQFFSSAYQDGHLYLSKQKNKDIEIKLLYSVTGSNAPSVTKSDSLIIILKDNSKIALAPDSPITGSVDINYHLTGYVGSVLIAYTFESTLIERLAKEEIKSVLFHVDAKPHQFKIKSIKAKQVKDTAACILAL